MPKAKEAELERELQRAAAFRAALRGFAARTEEVALEAGLTPQRYDLLLAIRAAEGGCSTVTELSQQLRLRQTTVTELVKRAEDSGLVSRERAADDGRVTLLRLTPEGERRLMRAFLALQDERRQLSSAMREVGARFRELTAGMREE